MSLTTRRSAEPFYVAFAAGGTAAALGALSFGVFHSIWILHVPRVFAESVVHALAAALALAWGMRATRRTTAFGNSLPDGFVLGGVLWLSLVPYELVGAKWGPWSLPADVVGVLKLSWLGFLGAPVGAAFGWFLTRQRTPTIAWAVAVLSVNMRVGGGIAGFGGRGTMFGLFLWLLPTYLLAGAALVTIYAVLRDRARINGHTTA